MKIIITGTPATGKSAVAGLLAEKLGIELFRIKDIAEKKCIVRGALHEVDINKLASALTFLKGHESYVVEGHLACEVRIDADFVVVLRCHPEVLKRRMARRKYPKQKIEENLMAEALDYCTQRVERVYKKKAIELDTSRRTAAGSAIALEKAIRQKKKKLDAVDYSDFIKKHLGIE